MSTLQHRVNNYLSGKHSDYVSEASEAETIDTIFQLLKKAEDDLSAAQQRVDRLKWELSKAQSAGINSPSLKS